MPADSRLAKVIADLRENFEGGVREIVRCVEEGEMDLDRLAHGNQDVYIDCAVTPLGLRRAGYGASRAVSEHSAPEEGAS